MGEREGKEGGMEGLRKGDGGGMWEGAIYEGNLGIARWPGDLS